MKNTVRFIAGYIVGFSVFLFVIPFGFYELSKLDGMITGKILLQSDVLRYVISTPFFLCGILFLAWSNIFLFKIGKGGPASAFGVSISPRTKKLVTSGPYRYSRNPMVFGAISLYISTVIFLNSIIGLAFLLIFLPVAVLYLKLSEERRLLKDFGTDYLEYKKHVSMLFPIKRLKK